MKQLSELVELAKLANIAGQGSPEMVNFRVTANPDNILAIAEAFRALEQRSEENQEVIEEYNAAMCVSNEAGYAGVTAAQTIRHLMERAEAVEAVEAGAPEIKAQLSREKIKAIINDDWLLMDNCEGFKNCDEVKELAIMALSALSGPPADLNVRERGENPSFHLLPGESEYDRLKRMYEWMKSKRKFSSDLPDLSPINNCLAFFASAIKSGESWSSTCQRDYDAALSILRNIEEAK